MGQIIAGSKKLLSGYRDPPLKSSAVPNCCILERDSWLEHISHVVRMSVSGYRG